MNKRTIVVLHSFVKFVGGNRPDNYYLRQYMSKASRRRVEYILENYRVHFNILNYETIIQVERDD